MGMRAQVSYFLVALIGWAGFFYVIDRLIMEGQGLPVSWNLMPL